MNITDITNTTSVTEVDGVTTSNGTGIFDKLMQTAVLHIEHQMEKNNITQGEAGEVYLGTIQAAMQQAVQYVLEAERIRLGKVPNTLR